MKKKLLICLFIFFMGILCEVRIKCIVSNLPEQYIFQKWDKTGSATQISVFFPEKSDVTAERISYAERGIDESNSWLSSYSARTWEKINYKGKNIELQVNYVGGNFFYFHDTKLKYGMYFRTEAAVYNPCVLDEEAAWKIFGATNVIGKNIVISDEIYEIVGIINNPYENSKGNAYVPYNEYTDISITEYELVMENPDKNYIAQLTEGEFIVIENSNRFKERKIIKNIRNINSFLVHEDNISYPYWENAARVATFQIMFLTILKYACFTGTILICGVALHK